MLTILLCSSAFGAACGATRVRVWTLVPIITIFCVMALLFRFSGSLTSDQAAIGLFVSLIFLQSSYLICAILRAEKSSHRLPIGSASLGPLSVMQRAIADEFADYFAPPDELPVNLRAKLATLALVS
jgi:hypothetical protein